MATENGFSNQKKFGRSEFKTIQSVGSNSFGAPSITRTQHEKTAAAAISSISPVLGINGKLEFYNVQFTSHGASIGDVMKMTTGTIVGWEFDIVKIVDANNFYILPTATPVATEQAEILGWTTLRTDANGNPQINVAVNTAGLATEAKQDDIIANQDYAPVNTPVVYTLSTGGGVTSSAYTEIVASTSVKTRKVQIFMSNGEPCYLAFGASSSEVNKLVIIPGGNGLIDFVIPASTRLSLKAVSTTLSTGTLIINFLG